MKKSEQPNAPPRPRRPIKFWQRTYLVTLGLFLVCLFGGVFGVAALSRNLSFDARTGEILSRQHMLVQSMAEDIAAMRTDRPDALPSLYSYYGGRYAAEGMQIAVWQDGASVYTNQMFGGDRPELAALQPGRRSWQVRLLNGRHVLFATTMLSDNLAGYIISGSSDIESFYAEWQRMDLVCLAAAAGVSVLFALGLYLVLKRMYRPLRSLTDTARVLAGGDFTARADPGRADELGELARTLNVMAGTVGRQMEELAAEAETKQQLVDNLSHEMRTPLTAIGGYAEYIQCAALSEQELLEATDTIRFESKRLLNLSNQLVKLSVLAHESLDFTCLSPAEMLDRVLRAVVPKAETRGVKLAVAIAPDTPDFRGDDALVESLLVNLADNAVKACGADGKVRLTAARSENGGCLFAVTDTGCGMCAEELAKIGRPFYRADKARSRAEGGAGLGAALCAAIAKAHGAALRYASEVGKGTRVTVDFPPCPPGTAGAQCLQI